MVYYGTCKSDPAKIDTIMRFSVSFVLLTVMAHQADSYMTQIFRSSCRKDALFKVTRRNAKLRNSTLASQQTNSLSRCAKLCINSKSCISINFNKMIGQCELLEKNSTTATAELHVDWSHYEPVSMVRNLFYT